MSLLYSSSSATRASIATSDASPPKVEGLASSEDAAHVDHDGPSTWRAHSGAPVQKLSLGCQKHNKFGLTKLSQARLDFGTQRYIGRSSGDTAMRGRPNARFHTEGSAWTIPQCGAATGGGCTSQTHAKNVHSSSFRFSSSYGNRSLFKSCRALYKYTGSGVPRQHSLSLAQ